MSGANRLFLIAIDEYREMHPLRGPNKDADALRGVLFERFGFSPEHTLELRNERATSEGILRAFRSLREYPPEDNLFVYYGGHGFTDSFDGTGYWIPHDAEKNEFRRGGWIPNSTLRGILRALPFRHVLLICDSCFSGDLLDEQRNFDCRPTPDYLSNASRLRSREVLTSGSSEPVSDVDLGGHSGFAFHLIDSLKNAQEEWIDAIRIYDHVRAGVGGQHPLYGCLAGAGHQRGGALILRARRGPAPEPETILLSDEQKASFKLVLKPMCSGLSDEGIERLLERMFEGVNQAGMTAAMSSLGLALKEQHGGNVERALSLFLETISIWPNCPMPYIPAVIESQNAGSPKQALELFDKYRELVPGVGLQPELLVSVGTCHLQLSNPDDAVFYLRQAHDRDPTGPLACLMLGNAYLAQGNIARALECFKRTQELDPSFNHTSVLRGIGLCYEKKDDKEEALFFYLRRHDRVGWTADVGQQQHRGARLAAAAAMRRSISSFLTTRRSAGESEALAIWRVAQRSSPWSCGGKPFNLLSRSCRSNSAKA
ncbi:MAG: tetratricopeptide repeat protein [Pseudomonadota bacterium]